MNKKVIIVGGVAGGASAAARLRRLDEDIDIIMFEKGEYISFANCGLPYYIGDTITDREKLIVQTVESMSDRFNMDIRNLSEVVKIDRENKKVTIKDYRSNDSYEESYDVLVLSPGASPIKPPITGIDQCDNLFTLRNIPDTDKIKGYVDNNRPKRAVVVGGGFIGLEMAENLYNRGIELTIVEASEQVMAPLDYEMASDVHNHLMDKGVNLILNDGVNSFKDFGKKVVLSSGKEIDTDMIILSIGVRPESSIAKDADLKLNERGAIVVDSHMKTSDESIYAIGDAVEVVDYINKKPTMIPLAWPANRQGRLVADHIAGKDVSYKGTLGSSVAKVFDYTVATTGNNEKTLKRIGKEFEVVHIHPSSHAGYYPGAFPISLKMIFEPDTGKILGAQGVGISGVDKRIDVIATAIKGRLTAYDLPDVETCYAPPYNSAKDPVNMLGYCASNILEGDVENIQWSEVDSVNEGGGFIIDVREEAELATGAIDGVVNIPLWQLRDRLIEIPRDKKIYVTCQVGLRGYIACRILKQNGFDCANIDGGMKTYLTVKRAQSRLKSQNALTEIFDNSSDDKLLDDSRNIDSSEVAATFSLDTSGLNCPNPIKMIVEEVNKLNSGEVLEIKSSDTSFSENIKEFCEETSNTLIKSAFDSSKNAFTAFIEKGKND
jgi:CoA-disulfide reductase